MMNKYDGFEALKKRGISLLYSNLRCVKNWKVNQLEEHLYIVTLKKQLRVCL